MYLTDAWYEDEVRSGFYVPAMMKRCWAAQLAVLERFDVFCREHGLKWYAAYGTLLGAARHKGYIPWDDDIDIFMPRRDVRRLAELAETGLPDGLRLFVPEKPGDVEKGVPLSWRLFNAAGDELLPMERWGGNHGFPLGTGLEIFALDDINPDTEEENRREELYSAVIDAIRLEQIVETSRFEDLTEKEQAETLALVERYLSVFESEVPGQAFDRDGPLLAQLIILLEKLSSEAHIPEGREAEEVAEMVCWCVLGTSRFPAHCFQGSVVLPFEGMEIPAPQDYVPVLEADFGQWRIPRKPGGDHSYPSWGNRERYVKDTLGDLWPFLYQYAPAALDKPERQPDPADMIAQRFALLRKAHQALRAALQAGQAEMALDLLARCQEQAQEAGSTLERDGIGAEGPVSLLEDYCETVFKIYHALFGAYEGETK